MPVSFEEVNREMLRSGSWAGEVEHVRQDGRHLNVSTIWALVRDDSGNPANVIETNTDVTARIAAQRELEVANEQLRRMAIELERSNGELQEFARIASHDLSAPITSARWLVDLLTLRHRASLNEEGQKCLSQVAQSLSRMSDLVDAVLKHAQVGTSSVTTSAATPLSDSVNSALEDLGRQIDLSGAKIACELLPSVQVEPNALNQLFQNLISNAIKYRSPDAPAIHISARWERPWWVISVRDNGVGIDPAWHERIFHPMQRLHGGDVSGSGIGLATCRKIVTRAGGRIWVESHPGKGSTFFFTLPGPETSAHGG
jgi:light-regulated signal transduction histidine kinase (bacteriophytochrome)